MFISVPCQIWINLKFVSKTNIARLNFDYQLILHCMIVSRTHICIGKKLKTLLAHYTSCTLMY